MKSTRKNITHPMAFLGAFIALFFSWLPAFCLLTGHPAWPLFIGLIALPILELLFSNYHGPIPYWNFWALRIIIFGITIQGILGAILAAHYPWWLVLLAGAGSGYAAGSSGNALGHELGHSRKSLDKFLAKLFFTTVCFGHYTQEHGAGHHVLVGTPKDSLYTHVSDNLTSFSKRNMIKQLRLGIDIAKSRNNIWSEVYGPIVIYLLLNLTLGMFYGWKAIVFLTMQTIVMYMVDASITFIQHWALHRKATNGRFERVGPQHTWDCDNWITTVVSFNNCRHVDHHINPGKDLNGLENIQGSPMMPYGYAVMGTLANFPGLFRKLIEPHLPQH